MEQKLKKLSARKQKRLGRGYGGGKGGHTSGRGQKGQKSRGKINVIFEGLKVKKSFIKRLPLRRGKGRFKPGAKSLIVKLGYLNLLPQDSVVDIDTLAKAGIVDLGDAKKFGVKILGDGKLEKILIIKLPISKSAALEVAKVGGKVETFTKTK